MMMTSSKETLIGRTTGGYSLRRFILLNFVGKHWILQLIPLQVTKEDIIEFEAKYKGSEEEAEDIRQLYEEHKGDMDKIMSSVMCATAEDEPRIREAIQKMIDEGQVKSYKAFASEPEKKKQARMRKAGKEAEEAEQMAKELGLDKNSG